MAEYTEHPPWELVTGAACPFCFAFTVDRGDRRGCDLCGWLGPKAPPKEKAGKVETIAGLDLGELQDYTAFMAMERRTAEDGAKYDVQALYRFELGTPYTQQVRKIVEWMSRPPLDKARLLVDQTGVGNAVVDMFRESSLGSRITPVTITAGRTQTRRPDGGWNVAKAILASVVQSVFSGRRIAIAKALPMAATAVRELKQFKVEITPAGNETYEAWREKDHDDIVLALAMALWHGEGRTVARAALLSRG